MQNSAVTTVLYSAVEFCYNSAVWCSRVLLQQCCTVQYSAVQCSTVLLQQCCTVQYSDVTTVLYSAVHCCYNSAVQCITVLWQQWCTVQYSAVTTVLYIAVQWRYNSAVQCSTVLLQQYCTVQYTGVTTVQYSFKVQWGVVQCTTVQYSAVHPCLPSQYPIIKNSWFGLEMIDWINRWRVLGSYTTV